jgi:3-methyladenine DNA glycosylase AlkC
MPEPFKNLLNADVVRAAGQHLARAGGRAFDRSAFEHQALGGLDALEMKARAMQIADALEATLPADFERAAGWIEAALAPPVAVDGVAGHGSGDAGLAGWVGWPLGEFVARRGLGEPERALQCLHALTQRFTAEWAIRPFIEAHPGTVWPTLERWTADPSPHVRRLVSEGSRPRLPWGMQLKGLIRDPSPTLPLLRALQDDGDEYVRRSVANHLNDIAKDHPALVAAWLKEHLPGAGRERRALLRHASRTLIKAGDAAVLSAWGLGRAFKGSATLAIAPKKVALGGAVTLAVVLGSGAKRGSQDLVLDYAVHHVKANGGTSAKVFKGWTLQLAAGERRQLSKSHPLREITTRRYHAGPHRVELLINGAAVAEAAFDLKVPA